MKSRLVGVIVTAVILIAAYMFWRSAATPGGGGAREDAPPSRGGQIVVTIRAEPRSFNRIVARDQTTLIIDAITQGRLVRINRATFELEPWLAERWESSADGKTHTLHLRPGIQWSDGTPLTSADVLFSIDAIFDPKSNSVLADTLSIDGKPIGATAPDPQTVVLTYPSPSGLGVRLLDSLTILPKHKLEAALKAGTMASAWNSQTPPADLAGTGPFVLREYQPGQRLIYERNPHFWRKGPDGGPLPYADRLVLEVVPEQNAELLRLQSGAADILNGEIRPEDYVSVRRAQEQGQVRLIELGVSTDADALWFCLKPEAKRKDPRFAFVQKPEFRQAISHAVDREAFAETVFLGAAVPIWGPITPGNQPWFWPDVPRYAHDVTRARELLKNIGLEDRNGNGVVEDAAGTEARFTVITQQGLGYYERGTAVLRDEAAKVGIALDVAPLEFGAMIERLLACNYDAIYMRPLVTDLDPAGNLDFWLSSGDAHLWNIGQKTPQPSGRSASTRSCWSRRPPLTRSGAGRCSTTLSGFWPRTCQCCTLAAPRMYGAHSARLSGVVPSVMRPNISGVRTR